jgi:hypothetical protein
VFVSSQRPFDVTAMNRVTMEKLGDSHVFEIHVATAEDALISKLECYRKTNERSERQWDDVTRLLKLVGDAADMDYLRASAESVGGLDLLESRLSTL